MFDVFISSCSFFLTHNSIGKVSVYHVHFSFVSVSASWVLTLVAMLQNRAQAATELLQELNSDVSGNFVEEVGINVDTHTRDTNGYNVTLESCCLYRIWSRPLSDSDKDHLCIFCHFSEPRQTFGQWPRVFPQVYHSHRCPVARKVWDIVNHYS